MLDILKKYKHSKLLTVNTLVNKTKSLTMDEVKKYVKDLSQPIQRTDFIPYDKDGNKILNHRPKFKGWRMCDETSGEDLKVAINLVSGKTTRIYFDTAQGAVVVSTENMSDNCTYNDLAIFFESKLELN